MVMIFLCLLGQSIYSILDVIAKICVNDTVYRIGIVFEISSALLTDLY